MHALVFRRFGGPEVLEYAEIPRPTLIPGHAIVRMKAIGLNFADVYRRKGNYHLKGSPPFVAGYEGAGVVEEIDTTGVDAEIAAGVDVGTRVGFGDVPFSNAEYVLAPLTHLIPLPDDITFETAAGILLQGLTAQYLVADSHPIRPTDTVVVHAAAGGVGQVLCQLAKHSGAHKVIGLTSSAEKKEVALAQAKCDEVFLYSEDWVGLVKAATDGKGASVVYDSVGSTLDDSFRATRQCGHVVFYGMAGGDPKHVDPRYLMDESKTLTGGDLWSYLTSHAERVRRSRILFEALRSGAITHTIAATYPLAEGAHAHEALESRKVAGKILLIPA